MKPFLRYIGGKGQLSKKILERLPMMGIKRYAEPFLGGGAIFLALLRRGRLDDVDSLVLTDSSAPIVQAWYWVQKDPKLLIEAIGQFKVDDKVFYHTRDRYNAREFSGIEAAAAVIFLSRCGFNGVWRTNKSGGYNAPWGDKEDDYKVVDPKNLLEISSRIQGARIEKIDFEEVLNTPNFFRPGSLVYFDPPYVPTSSTSFTAFTEHGFSITKDQERLAVLFEKLAESGASPYESNSDTPWIRERYSKFHVTTIWAKRSVNSDKDGRKKVKEVLVEPFSAVGKRRRGEW